METSEQKHLNVLNMRGEGEIIISVLYYMLLVKILVRNR